MSPQFIPLDDEETKLASRTYKVEPHLYYGGIDKALDNDWLGKKGVSYIITVSRGGSDGQRVEELCRNSEDIIYGKVDMWMEMKPRDIIKDFNKICATINDEISIQRGAVLVHCDFATVRSPTVVMAYQMQKYRKTCDQVLPKLKIDNSHINLDEHHESQLRIWEKYLGLKQEKSKVDSESESDSGSEMTQGMKGMKLGSSSGNGKQKAREQPKPEYGWVWDRRTGEKHAEKLPKGNKR